MTDPLGIEKHVTYQFIGNRGYLTYGWKGLRDFYGFSGKCWFLIKYEDITKITFSIFNEHAQQVPYHGWVVKTIKREAKALQTYLGIVNPKKESPYKFCSPNSSMIVFANEGQKPSFNVTLSESQASGSKLVMIIYRHLF